MGWLKDPNDLPDRRWTMAEYHADVESGWLENHPIYLYRGRIVRPATITTAVARSSTATLSWLFSAFHPDYEIRPRCPFETVCDSVLEPNGAATTDEQGRRWPHPNTGVFTSDIADTAVDHHRTPADDYAAAGVPEHWLLNLADTQIEVYRDPVADPATTTGWRYASQRVYREGESVAPLARPDAAVAVATLVAGPR